MTRFCKDCKWHEIKRDTWSALARVEQGHYCTYGEDKIDLVNGEGYKQTLVWCCYQLRAENGNCGPDGKNWEAKDGN